MFWRNAPFLLGNPIWETHSTSRLLRHLLKLWSFLRPSLFLVTLTDLKSTGQVFCRMCLFKMCLMFLLLLDRGYVIWGGRPQRESAIFITSYKRYMCGTSFVDVDVDLDHVTEAYLSSLSTVKLLCLCSFPHWTLWKVTTVLKFTPKSRAFCSFLVRADSLHILFGILLQERPVYSPHLFIHSLIYLSNYISIDSRILILCVESYSDLLYFLAQIVLALDK